MGHATVVHLHPDFHGFVRRQAEREQMTMAELLELSVREHVGARKKILPELRDGKPARIDLPPFWGAKRRRR